MENGQLLYLRLRHRVQVRPSQHVYFEDIAQYIVAPHYEEKLKRLRIHTVSPEDRHLIVIDVVKVIKRLQEVIPHLEVEVLGPSQTIIEIVYPQKSPQFLLVLFVWILLFTGSGLAIMNFHEDVSMLAVHQRIYKMMTGIEEPHPLWLQIPYSFGIGIGMILFFNHVFKKRLNEEPSPLEVEMFNYQQSLDHYVVMHENKEVEKKLNDNT
ncbi:stage V sporulation protein AA [Caldalkalibacillus thermarum TA2.A1]|uniref:Stage V sporulation protein AA n=1 Tax=Caldalkalibacillus thermarum (strain TA2.A1) TaxID=986075 RepID=F5L882_CALTT|nr:stage V sporulation protein AA [Caldalkalibacillus thermarum]EGL82495.1 stage V sporulation protein AA [Caldalkalibacillus thermarum TA2.A1]QZT33158.1 stage V sporulation protein AA [Caldalkalibacillus thermarum TA2.A1]